MSRWWERADVRRPPPRPAGRRVSESHQILSVVAHLSPLPVVGCGMLLLGRPVVWLAITLPIGPLLVLLAIRTSPMEVRRHAVEALNFNITIAAAALTAAIGLSVTGRASTTMILLPVLLLLLLVVVINWLVLLALAALEAGRGTAFQYPAIVRLIREPDAGSAVSSGERNPSDPPV